MLEAWKRSDASSVVDRDFLPLVETAGGEFGERVNRWVWRTGGLAHRPLRPFAMGSKER